MKSDPLKIPGRGPQQSSSLWPARPAVKSAYTHVWSSPLLAKVDLAPRSAHGVHSRLAFSLFINRGSPSVGLREHDVDVFLSTKRMVSNAPDRYYSKGFQFRPNRHPDFKETPASFLASCVQPVCLSTAMVYVSRFFSGDRLDERWVHNTELYRQLRDTTHAANRIWECCRQHYGHSERFGLL